MTKQNMLKKIQDNRFMPLYYHADVNQCIEKITACYDAGIHVFEFTNRGANALEHFKTLKEYGKTHWPLLSLGIGTIYSKDEAKAFLEQGAAFIVQPICTQEVAMLCDQNDILWIPGVMTLNEIYQAITFGALIVKVFPASSLGHDYIKALRGPMPSIPIMVTGGVEATPEDTSKWFKAGANVCGLGSQLFVGSNEDIIGRIGRLM